LYSQSGSVSIQPYRDSDSLRKHRYITWTLLLLFLICQPFFILSINATETITLEPIAYRCVSNTGAGEDYLTVSYEEGLKWVTYFAFNLSEIPSGASVDSAVLKIKTELVSGSAWVSAYSSSNAEWSITGISWDTKPNVDKYFDAVWVSANEEWYTWESSSFTDAVSDAFRVTGKLTVMLKSGLLIDQTGFIIFYPDAKLEVTYTPPKIDPIISAIATVLGIISLAGVLYLGYYLWKKGFFKLPKVSLRVTRTVKRKRLKQVHYLFSNGA
jgi:hypothetical protein